MLALLLVSGMAACDSVVDPYEEPTCFWYDVKGQRVVDPDGTATQHLYRVCND